MTTARTNVWETIDLSRHGTIEASAGTGKTFTIENLVVRLLTQPSGDERGGFLDIDRILVVTYTEKAAAELRSRIRGALEQRIGVAPDAFDPHIEHLRTCLTRFDQAAIHTIHSFCSRYLSAHAFESGSVFGAALVDMSDITREAVNQVLRGELLETGLVDAETLSRRLQEWDVDSVEQLSATMAGVAARLCEGRGDVLRPTRDLPRTDSRYRALREFGGASASAVESFTRNWGDIKQLLGLKRAPRGLQDKLAVLRALLTLPEAASPADALRIMSGEQFAPLLKSSAHEYFLPVASHTSDDCRPIDEVVRALNGTGPADFGEFLGCLDELCSSVRESSETERLAGLRDLIAATRAHIRTGKTRSRGLTYDDMIVDMHRAVLAPDSPLLSVLRQRFRYGVIDEFQDTNRQQWRIFRAIFAEGTAPTDAPRCLYVVGDPKQSIFSFQNADVAVYHAAVADLAGRGAQSLPLSVNYRSSTAMVDACNALFSDEWFGAASSGIGYTPVSARPSAVQDEWTDSAPDELRRPVVFARLTPAPLSGASPTKPAKAARLAAWTRDIIAYLVTPVNGVTPMRIPTSREDPCLRNLRAGDIAILVEKHAEALPVMGLLRQAGIPYTKQRNAGLFASDDCLSVILLLDAVDRPHDATRVGKALLSAFFGYSPADLAHTPDTWDDRWAEDVDKLRAWSTLAGRAQWGRLFGAVFADSRLMQVLRNDPEQSLRSAAFKQLRGYCVRRLVDGRTTLEDLVKELRRFNSEVQSPAEEEDLFNKETEGEAVKILTMHSSKGLEFPVVFVAGGKGNPKKTAVPYSLPNDVGGNDVWLSGLAKATIEELHASELRRLYYVALTRAQYRLFVPLWDEPDANTGLIESRYDSGSASKTFLARHCHDALARHPELFAVCATPPRVNPAPVSGRQFARVPTHEDAGLTTATVSAVPPSQRMTVQRSYSGLVRTVMPQPGANEVHDAPAVHPAMRREALTPGAATGDALHALLEQADFAQWRSFGSAEEACDDTSIVASVQACLGDRRILHVEAAARTRQIHAAISCVWHSLAAHVPDPAGGPPIILGDIATHERMREAEFHFVFDRDGVPFPNPTVLLVGGWMLGFMDLMFRHNSRYYVLDWKSNWLADGYDAAAIGANMAHHRYDVQYRVYSLAIHNWLSQRMADYRAEAHFGGVVYVYLRGARAGRSDCGVWSMRPSIDELTSTWPRELGVLIRTSQGVRS
jgi:exodeoxyribonuclease V beta subunit